MPCNIMIAVEYEFAESFPFPGPKTSCGTGGTSHPVASSLPHQLLLY